jgi:hypothetical protein
MRFKKNLAVLGLLGAGMMISAASQAVQTTYYISANCVDCTPTNVLVSAQLILEDYTLGDPLDISNFVYFSYSGSNLVNSYSIISGGDDSNPTTINDFDSDFMTISGSISNVPGTNELDMFFDDGLHFRTHLDGTWSTCAPGPGGYYSGNSCFLPADQGANALYSLTPVPEPSHLAMMLAGLGCLAPVLRKRKIKA